MSFDDFFLCARAARAFVSNSPKEAEALTIIFALNYTVAKGFSRIQVFFDALEGVQCINGSLDWSLITRVVNGSVLVQVHGGPGTETIKEKEEPNPNLEPFRNQFLGSGTGPRTIYEAGLDPSLSLDRE